MRSRDKGGGKPSRKADSAGREGSSTADRQINGEIVLVSTPIGNLGDVSKRAEESLREADVIACEDTRVTRKLLSALGIPGGSRLMALHRHNEYEVAGRLVGIAATGRRVAVVSDAGTPGVSDPGEVVVREALSTGVKVSAVPGASSLIAALVVSGMPTSRFVFEGFLPTKGSERTKALDSIVREDRTVVVFESPRRLARTLNDLYVRTLSVGHGSTSRPVAVVRELTKFHEEVWRGSLADAAEHFGEREVKGEIVVVIGPAEVQNSDLAEERGIAAKKRTEELLAEGATVKEAVATVCDETGIDHRTAYDIALATKAERSAAPPEGQASL